MGPVGPILVTAPHLSQRATLQAGLESAAEPQYRRKRRVNEIPGIGDSATQSPSAQRKLASTPKLLGPARAGPSRSMVRKNETRCSITAPNLPEKRHDFMEEETAEGRWTDVTWKMLDVLSGRRNGIQSYTRFFRTQLEVFGLIRPAASPQAFKKGVEGRES